MGLIADVSGGNPVSSTWGNAIRDAAVMNVTAAERASITPVEGQLIYVSDEDRFYTYSGSAWVRVGWGATTTGRTGCTIKRAANQSITSGAGPTLVSFDGEDFDSDGFFTATATDLTIPTGLGGLYAIHFQIWWGTNPGTSTFARCRIIPASGNYLSITGDSSTVATSAFGGSVWLSGGGAVLPLTAGDQVGVGVAQGSGGAVNLTARLTCYRIGV